MSTRTNIAPMKVINLGLPRTGNVSMRAALEMLGFGPSYQIFFGEGLITKDLPTWSKVGDGIATPEDLDAIFKDFQSMVDIPAPMFAAELYATYPDAKFLLTTRDPAKWEKSMIDTIMPLRQISPSPSLEANRNQELIDLLKWSKHYCEDKYLGGRLASGNITQKEILDHNERIRRIIPPEKLLVYQVGEGWERLVDFLGVPKPEQPFPHLNDTNWFKEEVLAAL